MLGKGVRVRIQVYVAIETPKRMVSQKGNAAMQTRDLAQRDVALHSSS
jgi:hypothetical protein